MALVLLLPQVSPSLGLRCWNSEIRELGQVNAKLPSLFAPFPGANPRLLQTQRDSSLSGCLQPANPEQCLTARNNYLASFALSTFQIQGGDKATFPVAQARNPSRGASRLEAPTLQESLRDERHWGISPSPLGSPLCPGILSDPFLSRSCLWVLDGPIPRFSPKPGTRNPARPGDTTPEVSSGPIYFPHPPRL